MNDFVFQSPTRFVFGRGYADRIGGEVTALGAKRALLVYGGGSVVRNGLLARVTASLEAAGRIAACTAAQVGRMAALGREVRRAS